MSLLAPPLHDLTEATFGPATTVGAEREHAWIEVLLRDRTNVEPAATREPSARLLFLDLVSWLMLSDTEAATLLRASGRSLPRQWRTDPEREISDDYARRIEMIAEIFAPLRALLGESRARIWARSAHDGQTALQVAEDERWDELDDLVSRRLLQAHNPAQWLGMLPPATPIPSQTTDLAGWSAETEDLFMAAVERRNAETLPPIEFARGSGRQEYLEPRSE